MSGISLTYRHINNKNEGVLSLMYMIYFNVGPYRFILNTIQCHKCILSIIHGHIYSYHPVIKQKIVWRLLFIIYLLSFIYVLYSCILTYHVDCEKPQREPFNLQRNISQKDHCQVCSFSSPGIFCLGRTFKQPKVHLSLTQWKQISPPVILYLSNYLVLIPYWQLMGTF